MDKANLLCIYLIQILMLFVCSCTSDIELNQMGNNSYGDIENTVAYLRDTKTGKNENVIELYEDIYNASMFVGLNKVPNKGVDVNISYDKEYIESYNSLHGTSFLLFPIELIEIGNQGNILLAPDEKCSHKISLLLKSKNEDNNILEDGKTYLLPLKLEVKTEGVKVSEEDNHLVYIIKKSDSVLEPNCYKGEDAVRNFVFFEVGEANPLNALEFLREDNKLFFDYVVLFAANIRYNPVTAKVEIWKNPSVQFLLDNNEEYIQPLRKRGIKVLLGILGNNGDVSGVCQLSELGARQLAKEMAAICYSYNLDGVNFDDEYSGEPDLRNPLLASKSTEAGVRLLYETKRAMPDKDVTVYYLSYLAFGADLEDMLPGYTSDYPDIDGMAPGDFLDVAVPNYGGRAEPVRGMTRKQCAGMAIELNLQLGDTSVETAQSVKANGYGFYMWFCLSPKNFGTSTGFMQNVSRGLYDMELLPPKFYYKKNDLTRYPIN